VRIVNCLIILFLLRNLLVTTQIKDLKSIITKLVRRKEFRSNKSTQSELLRDEMFLNGTYCATIIEIRMLSLRLKLILKYGSKIAFELHGVSVLRSLSRSDS
jgi:hypothetical protein